MADRRVDAIEIARTVDGQTDMTSHLRRIGAGITLCGIRITPNETIGESRIWYPVSDDESGRFLSCNACESQSSSYRVVSRPAASVRPQTSEGPLTLDEIGNLAGLYGAAYNGIAAYMAGKSIVPHSITADVYRILWSISFATVGDGLNGRMSADSAAKALAQIADLASAARYDLDPYVPASVRREDAAVSILRARDDEIKRRAKAIYGICNGDHHPIALVAIQNQAAEILRALNDDTASESVETSKNT
jgi:hypothetical protein